MQSGSKVLEEKETSQTIQEHRTRAGGLTIIKAPTRISAGPVAKLGMLAVIHKRSQGTTRNVMSCQLLQMKKNSVTKFTLQKAKGKMSFG